MYKFSEKTPQPLDQCSDETLCQLVAGGSREAEEALVTRYNRLVRTCARPFFLVGGDSEDLTQEGMVGLLKAVREYDASKEASFRTFAEICIRNRLYSVLRAAARDKHMALNQSVPLDTPFFDANSYTSGTSDLTQRDPEAYLIDREHTAALLSGVRKQLSECRQFAAQEFCVATRNNNVPETVGKPPKSVDNAVQRIRRKVARQLLSVDLSGS